MARWLISIFSGYSVNAMTWLFSYWDVQKVRNTTKMCECSNRLVTSGFSQDGVISTFIPLSQPSDQNAAYLSLSLFAVHRFRWWHQCRVSSVTCFARWWENSPIWDLNPLPQLTQKMTGAEVSGRPWRRLWSCWYFCCIFSSKWLFPLCMACLHCCRSFARVSQWSTVMCVAFRCH